MNRTLHLDLRLGCYRPDYLAALWPRLAAAGYTAILVELADSLRLDTFGDAAAPEAYTKDTFAELLQGARSAGLTPIPLVQSLGHSEHLLTHPAFHHLREAAPIASTMCPTNPETHAFLDRLIDEVAELFAQPPYFHLGADEVWLLGACPRCRQHLGDAPKWTLFAEHLDRLSRRVAARGIRPIAWADIALGHPDLIDRFDRRLVWMDWDYWTGQPQPPTFRDWGRGRMTSVADLLPESRRRFGDWILAGDDRFRAWGYADYLMAQGFDVMLAPAMRSSGDHAFAPAPSHLDNVLTAANRMHRGPAPLGMTVTSWSCRVNPIETQWPGILLPAAADTRPADAPAELLDRVIRETFGQPWPQFLDIWTDIAAPCPYADSLLAISDDAAETFLPRRSLREALRLKPPDLPTELPRIEALAERYRDAHRRLLATAPAIPADNLPFACWEFAGRAIAAKAHEYRLSLLALDARPDTDAAADLLLETEALRDDYRRLLARIYLPEAVTRHVNMMYAATLPHLYHLAWNRILPD